VKVKAWFFVTFSGLFLVAAAVLIALQVGNRSEFLLYVHQFRVDTNENAQVYGGVNVALLMLLSALGGLKARWMIRVFGKGLKLLRQARRQERTAEAAARKAQKTGGAPAKS